MFTSIQATKEFYASLDKLWMSRGADCPMNKTSSVPVSSPLNKLVIQTLEPHWIFTGSQSEEEPWVLFLSKYDNFHYGNATFKQRKARWQIANVQSIIYRQVLLNLDMINYHD